MLSRIVLVLSTPLSSSLLFLKNQSFLFLNSGKENSRMRSLVLSCESSSFLIRPSFAFPNFSPANSHLIASSRFSRRHSLCKQHGWFEDFSKGVRTRNYKRFYNTRSAYGGDECSSTNRTALSKRKNQSTSVLQVLDMPENNYLKAVVLSGLFTLLFTQQASAASEVATGLQSFPFFGDLGDLSTGVLVDILF
ncbi:hypothetical protein AABB24_034983 [Solanum stoloniferum]|uniref:Uncharacterized protein n=1 Tax=Solanum stoloniferum TaxID=62892 RepID=A0ABD2RHV3_9SOLN